MIFPQGICFFLVHLPWDVRSDDLHAISPNKDWQDIEKDTIFSYGERFYTIIVDKSDQIYPIIKQLFEITTPYAYLRVCNGLVRTIWHIGQVLLWSFSK